MDGPAIKSAEIAPAVPVTAGERIVSLDFIRGIAVLGILFANITAYAQPYLAYGWPPGLSGGMTASDQAVWLVQFVLVDGKFRGLFTLLFGAGLCLFHDRVAARGEGIGRQLRRLAILLLFGLAHYFLLWRGDILTLYAVWGAIALVAVEWPRERQLALGLTLSLFGALFMILTLGLMWTAPGYPPVRADVAGFEESAAEIHRYLTFSFAEIVSHTLATELPNLQNELVMLGLTETIGYLLLGMAAYRYGLFEGAIDPVRLRKWGWPLLWIGLATSLAVGLWPLREGFPRLLTNFVFSGLGTLPHFVTTLGLLALLAAWAPRVAAGPLGRLFGAAGRMAFTNYLGTSLVLIPLFHGWGLGLFGRYHRVELLAFVGIAWIVMLAFSWAWLARFRYGPLEWLWRCLTYGRLFKIVR